MTSIIKKISFALILLTALSVFPQNKTLINKVSFSGNYYFNDDKVINLIASHPGLPFIPEQFELDAKNILNNYRKEGFINVRLKDKSAIYNSDSTSVNLVLSIDEGNQLTVGQINIFGNKIISTKEILSSMFTKTGKVFDAGTLQQDINQIISKYEQRGYSFVNISIKDISVEDKKEKLSVTLDIDENEKLKIDRVLVEGNTSTKSEVILREIRLNKNRTITKENITSIKQKLENLGYFEYVENPVIYKYKSSTVLKVKVKEGNTNTFDGIIGYVPPAENEAQGYFTGFINLSLRNLFGTGRRIDARWQKEVKTTQELELKYLEPWIFSFPANVSLNFLQRVQDSSYVKRNLSVKAETLISRYFSASVTAAIERVIPSVQTNTQSQINIFDSRLLAAGVEIKFDNRDYVYNPSKGILYRTSYSVGQKKIYNKPLNDSAFKSDFTVHRGIVSLDLYSSFFRRQSALISLHGEEVRSSRFEDADFFRIGGRTTIRGYREGQFLASRAAWANIELRYSLSRKSFVSVFFDPGYYRKPADEILGTSVQQGFIYGYGAGIQVETGLGVLGINYALGRGDTPLEGKIHFGIVNDF